MGRPGVRVIGEGVNPKVTEKNARPDTHIYIVNPRPYTSVGGSGFTRKPPSQILRVHGVDLGSKQKEGGEGEGIFNAGNNSIARD